MKSTFLDTVWNNIATKNYGACKGKVYSCSETRLFIFNSNCCSASCAVNTTYVYHVEWKLSTTKVLRIFVDRPWSKYEATNEIKKCKRIFFRSPSFQNLLASNLNSRCTYIQLQKQKEDFLSHLIDNLRLIKQPDDGNYSAFRCSTRSWMAMNRTVRGPSIHYRRNHDEDCNCRKIIRRVSPGRYSVLCVFRNVRPRPLYPRSINSQPDDTSIDTGLVFRFSSLRWQNGGNRVIRTQPPPVPDISSRDSRPHGPNIKSNCIFRKRMQMYVTFRWKCNEQCDLEDVIAWKLEGKAIVRCNERRTKDNWVRKLCCIFYFNPVSETIVFLNYVCDSTTVRWITVARIVYTPRDKETF